MSRLIFFFFFLLTCNMSILPAYDVSIISMFRNEAFYLKEWIEYHRQVGVEHFWLYNNGSTDHSLEILQPYIDEGLVEVIYWPTPVDHNWYVPTQVNAFKDGIKRAVGNSKWVALIDIDEFILPMRDRTILKCLKKYFSDADAVYVNWRNFGTGGLYVPQGEPLIFQLTACSEKKHSDNCVGKTIVKPECVSVDKVWYVHHFPLKSKYRYMNGNRVKMDFIGIDLHPDPKHYDKYIRINHYVLRDEWYYENVRLARALQGIGDLNTLLEHYIEFSLEQENTIVKFIKKNFPAESKRLWEQ